MLRGHQGNVNFVAYSPDGNTVASAGADGTVRFWRDDLPTDPNALRAWMNGVTDATVTSKPVGQ